MDELRTAFQRQVRFESGVVESVDDQSRADVRTGLRADTRSGSGRITGEKFGAGSRVITCDGQILGLNPFITE